jgi:hypothetical protein
VIASDCCRLLPIAADCCRLLLVVGTCLAILCLGLRCPSLPFVMVKIRLMMMSADWIFGHFDILTLGHYDSEGHFSMMQLLLAELKILV